jgi:hypothetical protein
MYDNHTFKQLSDNKMEAAKEATELFDKDPYGSVGFKGVHGNGLKVIGRGDKEAFKEDLKKWVESENTYFEEQQIGGVLHWRDTLLGAWTPYTVQELSAKYVELKKV